MFTTEAIMASFLAPVAISTWSSCASSTPTPAWTQRQLAKALGVSLGKTNYCVRALKEKDLVKWGNFTQNPNKLVYLHILTPEGLAHKLRLTAHLLARKEAEYGPAESRNRSPAPRTAPQ